MIPGRSISSRLVPRYSTRRRGRTGRPSASFAVSTRRWVSSNPITTSRPRLLLGVAVQQHPERLADAGGHPEKYAQVATPCTQRGTVSHCEISWSASVKAFLWILT